MDVASNEILLRGLSMPHSPRWYQDKLYFLESGEGSLARYDARLRTWITIAQLPGFTRGLDFWGPLAFIGLSQVRESAVFSGIPLVERLAERTCGVWVVDLRTGQTVGFLRFEEGVQEIFAVQVLPGIRFPEILELHDPRLAHAYVLPDAALAEVPPERREPAAAGPVPATPATPPGTPDPFAQAYHRGIALRDQDDFDGAIAAFQEAIAVRDDDADVWNDLANAFAARNRLDEAIAHYARAVAIRPDFAVAHMNMGMILMRTGDLPRGLAAFEWRWKTPGFLPFLCPQPQWAGRTSRPSRSWSTPSRGGRRDPVHPVPAADRGARPAGDPRRARAAAAALREREGPRRPAHDRGDRGCRVRRLHAADERAALPRPDAGHDPDADPVPPAAGGPSAALAGAGGDATGRASLGAGDGEREGPVATAADRVLKIGLVWAGSPSQGNDRNRSAHLEALIPLLEVPGTAFYSLQVGPRAADVRRLAPPHRVVDLSPDLRDWADTAAAIAQLDLVIGVDTGVIHLAGALGKPVWVLLCHAPDWRWGVRRPDSPWYPTMRLFWQPRPKDWAPVVAEAAAALGAHVRAPRAP